MTDITEVVALANTARSDLWVKLPGPLSAATVGALRDRIHAELDPNLTLYIEYPGDRVVKADMR